MTYSIPEPFESAVKRVRAALVRGGFSVPRELDISAQIRQSLGIDITQSTVMYVFCRQSFVEAMRVQSAIGIYLPLHVVISACSGQAEIHMLGSVPPDGVITGTLLASFVNRLRDEVSLVIEKIAIHRSYCQLRP